MTASKVVKPNVSMTGENYFADRWSAGVVQRVGWKGGVGDVLIRAA